MGLVPTHDQSELGDMLRAMLDRFCLEVRSNMYCGRLIQDQGYDVRSALVCFDFGALKSRKDSQLSL